MAGFLLLAFFGARRLAGGPGYLPCAAVLRTALGFGQIPRPTRLHWHLAWDQGFLAEASNPGLSLENKKPPTLLGRFCVAAFPDGPGNIGSRSRPDRLILRQRRHGDARGGFFGASFSERSRTIAGSGPASSATGETARVRQAAARSRGAAPKNPARPGCRWPRPARTSRATASPAHRC